VQLQIHQQNQHIIVNINNNIKLVQYFSFVGRRTHEESYKEAIIVDDDAEKCDNLEGDDNTTNPSRGISKRMKPS
jgi:hypothetical protein